VLKERRAVSGAPFFVSAYNYAAMLFCRYHWRACGSGIALRTFVPLVAAATHAWAAKGQSRRLGRGSTTSGLPRSTDIVGASRYVSKVPNADVIACESMSPGLGAAPVEVWDQSGGRGRARTQT
jgi:hypothetical protein